MPNAIELPPVWHRPFEQSECVGDQLEDAHPGLDGVDVAFEVARAHSDRLEHSGDHAVRHHSLRGGDSVVDVVVSPVLGTGTMEGREEGRWEGEEQREGEEGTWYHLFEHVSDKVGQTGLRRAEHHVQQDLDGVRWQSRQVIGPIDQGKQGIRAAVRRGHEQLSDCFDLHSRMRYFGCIFPFFSRIDTSVLDIGAQGMLKPHQPCAQSRI